jgi:TatD DNase family protein
MFIDTHCHLTDPALLADQAAVVHRAVAAGVQRMITIGTGPEDHPRVLQAIQSYPQVFGAIAVHPHLAGEIAPDFIATMRPWLTGQPRLLAVGECGLDYHGRSADGAVQRPVFIQQLKLARELKLPAILHVRDAHGDALNIMADFPDVAHVVHCFTGTAEEAARWLEQGAFVGITGIVTYKNAPDVRAVAKLVPENRLLVETDSPYLSPEPVRKIKNNEPAFVVHVAARVAAERGVSVEALAESTTANARRLFGPRLE